MALIAWVIFVNLVEPAFFADEAELRAKAICSQRELGVDRSEIRSISSPGVRIRLPLFRNLDLNAWMKQRY
jgi:hypothetical protein